MNWSECQINIYSYNVLLCYLLLVFSFILVQLNATLHLTNRQNNLLHYTFYVCLLKSKCISYMSYIDIANVHIPSEFLIFRLTYFRQYRIRPRFNSISSRERLYFPTLVVQTNDIPWKFHTSLLFLTRYLMMKYSENTVYIRVGIENWTKNT